MKSTSEFSRDKSLPVELVLVQSANLPSDTIRRDGPFAKDQSMEPGSWNSQAETMPGIVGEVRGASMLLERLDQVLSLVCGCRAAERQPGTPENFTQSRCQGLRHFPKLT